MLITAKELAHRLNGRVLGDDAVELNGFAPANTARSGDLTFAENQAYLATAEASAAAAVIVGPTVTTSTKTLIQVANVRVGFARALELFFPEPELKPGIHPSAIVATSATIDPTASVGPYCVVGERARLGPRSCLLGGVHLGPDCAIGADCRIYANVTLYDGTQIGDRVRIHAGVVIGSDGYGYVLDQGRHRKIPQVGWVSIEDDVEIGANVTIDRGTLGPTIVGRGTKIDNLVQLGHNVVTGEHCILVAQVGIAGSSKIGDYTVLAGQVGIAGHLTIGDRVTIAAKSGVMNHIASGEKWMGIPASPAHEAKRQLIALHRAPDMLRRLQALEKRMDELTRTAVARPPE